MKVDFAVRTQKAMSFPTYKAAEGYARQRALELPGVLIGIYQRVGEAWLPITDPLVTRRPRGAFAKVSFPAAEPTKIPKRKRKRKAKR